MKKKILIISSSFYKDLEIKLLSGALKEIDKNLFDVNCFSVSGAYEIPQLMNILLKDKNDLNSVKISDFGLSTIIQENETNEDCGTLIYMSPELHKTSENSDLWACGFILYILASGGLHPIYRNGMDRKTYIDHLTNIKEWSFPDTFPLYILS